MRLLKGRAVLDSSGSLGEIVGAVARVTYHFSQGSDGMNNSGKDVEMTTGLRRHPGLRVQAPFAYSFARIGLQRWSAAKRAGLGVVLDVSLSGARVMSQASMSPGDQLAISLRLPDQTAMVSVDATVRWGDLYTFGLEFAAVSQHAEARLRKFLSRTPLYRHRSILK